MTNNKSNLILIVGGHGKTGRRVASRLKELGQPVRSVSRSTEIPFDWADEATWPAALAGASKLYMTYYPDLAAPGAAEQVRKLTEAATRAGVEQIVLLAGRGEPQVHPAEDAVRTSGARWTILECAFFMQNFTEGIVAPQGDTIAFPAGETLEPFIDCDDIAEVAAKALTEDGHDGKTYELTGPRAISFGQATALLGNAQGRVLRYLPVTFEQYGKIMARHMPPAVVEFFLDLFHLLLDGHNSHTTSDVERVLGRPARDFVDFARRAEVSR